jgi:hypothetical protein
VDAYLMNDCGADCAQAASRAVETVYQLLCRQGWNLPPMVYGFDLEGSRKIPGLAGPSGGLAFVAATAATILDMDPGPVAATGILTAADPDAHLEPVRSIQAKLKAALELVPENGTVLYPAANDEEVDDLLRDRFDVRGIRLAAVQTPAEAVALLHGKQAGKPGRGRKTALFLLSFLMLLAALLFYQNRHGQEKGQPGSLAARRPAARPLVVSVPEPTPEKPVMEQAEPELPVPTGKPEVAAGLLSSEPSIPEQPENQEEEQADQGPGGLAPVPGRAGFD